jgi:hypothetical protein
MKVCSYKRPIGQRKLGRIGDRECAIGALKVDLDSLIGAGRPYACPASEPYLAWRARISMIANRASAMTANDTPVVAVPSA